MGREARVQATWNRKRTSGVARLETNELQFRGETFSLTIPFSSIGSVSPEADRLTVSCPEGTLTLHLGSDAAKWARSILHPPSRLEKIGVKPEWRVSVIGPMDRDFIAELRGAARVVSVGRTLAKSDAIFLGAPAVADLTRVARLKRSLQPAGALWVIRPKGRSGVPEHAVMAAGKAAGLVDVKVVAFSATHTAEKFVIRVKDRRLT